MLFKKNYKEKIFTCIPYHYDNSFVKLINLLTDTNILLTFEEREMLYKRIDYIVKFLEEIKEDSK